MIFKRANAFQVEKHGVRMHIYTQPSDCAQAAVVYQETETGHAEEFRHLTSAFIYYILEGTGTYFLDGQAHPVEATDVVVVPPGQRIYFSGKLKQLCITAPAWEASQEKHIRDVVL